VVPTSPTTISFKSGLWVVVSGTGVYAWDTCGEDGTGRIWQVIGYPQADRSVLFVYQYLMSFTDQHLAAAGEASLKTFQIKPDLVD
jgi:hypothetical protein